MTTIRDLLQSKTTSHAYYAMPEWSVERAHSEMFNRGVPELLVLDDSQQILGIITLKDLIDNERRYVRDVMIGRNRLTVVDASRDVQEILDLMKRRYIKYILVYEGNGSYNLISEDDILRFSMLERADPDSGAINKLAGDSTTDAPPPDKKKKQRK